MSLKFILGGSGSGKSRALYKSVIESSIREKDRQFIVIVPEQFTLQTQLDVVAMHPDKGIMNIDVLSFERLAYRVLDETGGNEVTVLRDTGKSLLLQKAAADVGDELSVFGRNIHKQGYIGRMKSLISELAQYRIGPEELGKMTDLCGSRESLAMKLKDIRILQKKFYEYLGSEYITGEELLTRLCRYVPASRMLRDAVIAIDGFTGFTPVQLSLLEELMKVTDRMIITLECDRTEDPFHADDHNTLFALSRENCADLCRLAQNARTEILDPVWMEAPSLRYVPGSALAHLEQNLFRTKKKGFGEVPESVFIRRNRNPEEEVRSASAQILRLVREKGCRYRDIAVIVSDMGVYGNYFRLVMEECRLPYFMDEKRDIMQNAFVEYMRSAIALAEERFSYDSVFRFLKSGMGIMEQEDIFLLENYVLALGIHGYKKWQEKWVRRTDTMTDEELSHIESLREKLVDETSDFIAAMRDRKRTVGTVTRALYDLFIKQDIQQKCKNLENAFQRAGNLDLAREYSQIYRVVMDLFDQFAALLGGEAVSATEYRELLDAGLSEARIGITPPAMDQILIGDLERTRLRDIKCLFCVGFNDLYLPGEPERIGILTERERDYLAGKHVKLAPGLRERMYIQRFYLYLAMTKPSEYLSVSYSNTDMRGKSMRPSFYLQELYRIFPRLSEINEVPEELVRGIGMSDYGAMRYLAAGLHNGTAASDTVWKEVYSWYADQNDRRPLTDILLESCFLHNPDERLSTGRAGELYGKEPGGSVTRLQTFLSCPYSYFLRYGLKLSEREEYLFRPVDEGSVIHRALYLFGKKMAAAGYDWRTVSADVQRSVCSEALEEAAVDYGNSVLYSTARRSFALRRMEQTLYRTVWALCEQLKPGSFVPEEFELTFDRTGPASPQIVLDNGTRMALRGSVDRLDLASGTDSVYVKVLDYKTGSKSFDFASVYYGLDLQLFLYLSMGESYAAGRFPGKEIVPAGVLYYHVWNPLIDKAEAAGCEDEKMLKKLGMSGVVNSRMDALAQFDACFAPESSAEVSTGELVAVPVSRNKDGNLSARTGNTLTTEEFGLIRSHLERKIRQAGDDIMDGHIEISPALLRQTDSCRYCPFGGVCRFDGRIPGYRERLLPAVKKDDVIAAIRKEAE